MAGRPKAEINWNELNAMLKFDASARYCANELKIARETLEKRIRSEHGMTFGEYKDMIMDDTRQKLRSVAIGKALKGENVMLIFCLKNLCGWADQPQRDEKSEQSFPSLKYAKEDLKKHAG